VSGVGQCASVKVQAKTGVARVYPAGIWGQSAWGTSTWGATDRTGVKLQVNGFNLIMAGGEFL
jgi:hypothetical protein